MTMCFAKGRTLNLKSSYGKALVWRAAGAPAKILLDAKKPSIKVDNIILRCQLVERLI